MPTFITYWDCTIAQSWSSKGFNARINAMRLAVGLAAAEATRVGLHGSAWIFVGPEYAFGNAEAGLRKPAVHVNTKLETTLRQAMGALTTTYGTLLLAPGTIPVWEGQRGGRTARNTSYGYYGGAQVWRVDKRNGVGEVSPEELQNRYLIFRPGTGYASVTVSGRTYGVEICADATHGGTLPAPVQRQIVQGQGVGFGFGPLFIANKSTEMLIVAAMGTYGVYNHHGNAIASYGHRDIGDVRMHYYQA